MQIAQVCFLKDFSTEVEDKRYSYFTDIEDLDWEDIVVVETRYGVKTAIFMNYIESNEPAAKKASAWIIQRVDISELENKKAKLRKLQDIKSKLLARKAKVEERQIFEIMAKADPIMADLLKEYDSLLLDKLEWEEI
ncbi:hypothetical protein SAMN05444401_1756 [Clostridium amylolyticum]|uniref:Uncharacterized protein n=1 Tax=Clostridium amylolyticum TaxID=1121298 RepID=A0A1M6EZX5_9CLOT|nr:hypothetical protein [Clostridium amylolyticum]SHI90992.1 hypothetical protein SAMN05444401_1756 [Clostridium amylolyticum]